MEILDDSDFVVIARNELMAAGERLVTRVFVASRANMEILSSFGVRTIDCSTVAKSPDVPNNYTLTLLEGTKLTIGVGPNRHVSRVQVEPNQAKARLVPEVPNLPGILALLDVRYLLRDMPLQTPGGHKE